MGCVRMRVSGEEHSWQKEELEQSPVEGLLQEFGRKSRWWGWSRKSRGRVTEDEDGGLEGGRVCTALQAILRTWVLSECQREPLEVIPKGPWSCSAESSRGGSSGGCRQKAQLQGASRGGAGSDREGSGGSRTAPQAGTGGVQGAVPRDFAFKNGLKGLL